jgi:DtxR family Mn-dependent transcriptional regulator
MRTSFSEQDYLTTIYRLQAEAMPVGTGTLAAQLGVAPPSVTEMLGKLHREGLVQYTRHRGVTLREEGTHEALRLLRRHRLWEVFLTELLGLPWDQVHEEAHRLEHATSDLVANRLAEFLREPAADPHGQQIPDRNGALSSRPCLPLAEVEPGRTVQVLEVPDGDPALLRQLGELGFHPGAEVTVETPWQPDGTLAVRIGGTAHRLDAATAGRVYVANTNASGEPQPAPPGDD